MDVKSLAWGWTTKGPGYRTDWDETNPERIEVVGSVSVVEPNPVKHTEGKLVVVCKYKDMESRIPTRDGNDGHLVVELEIKDEELPEGYYSMIFSGCEVDETRSTPKSGYNTWRHTVSFRESPRPYRLSRSRLLRGHKSSLWNDRVISNIPKEFDISSIDSGQHGDFRDTRIDLMRWNDSEPGSLGIVNQNGGSVVFRYVNGVLYLSCGAREGGGEVALSDIGLRKLKEFLLSV